MTLVPRHPHFVPVGPRPAENGVDRCACGCKYWHDDRCIDCGAHVRHADRG